MKDTAPSGLLASEGLIPSSHGAHPAENSFTAAPLQTHRSASLPLPPVPSNAKFQSISAHDSI